MKNSEINGNWEERGVIGTRIEISDRKITILWRNSPVLQTTFSTKNDGEKAVLVLKDNKLRYSPTGQAYAEVSSIFYEDGKLTFNEMFPISGASSSVLTKTENSRYGNYTIADKEVFDLLDGEWEDEQGYCRLRFSRGKLTMGGETIKIHALKSNGYPDGEYKIANDDPSKYDVFYFSNMMFREGLITAFVPVCDAPSINMVFHRV